MKYLIVLLLFFSCCTAKKTMVVRPAATIVQIKTDTVPVVVKDTLIVHDTVIVQDTRQIKELNDKLYLANFKIERVRYYLKICQRRPSQIKFLVSWINRAIK